MTYVVGNPGPELGQAQKCGWAKAVNEILTLPHIKFLVSYPLAYALIFNL